jgi:2-methylcitrate dehydratase PrpD
VPAAVAVAEAQGRSVPELLRSVLCGYQSQADLARSFVLDERVHPHGALGAPAAALAAARLLRLDVGRTVHAINIAADLAPAGSWDSCVRGRTARHVLAGSGAAAGVRAAYLARAGVTGAPEALDLAFGHVRGHVNPDEREPEPQLTGWAIHRGYLKQWSACAWTHSVLDATASLLGSLRASAVATGSRVDQVSVSVPRVSMRLKDINRESALAVRFSIPLLVATLITYGELNSHVDGAWHDDEVLDLAARVTVDEDLGMTRRWPREMPAAVRVKLTDGATIDATVDDAQRHTNDEDYVAAVRGKLRHLHASERLLDHLMDQTNNPTSAPVQQVFAHVLSTCDRDSQRGKMS